MTLGTGKRIAPLFLRNPLKSEYQNYATEPPIYGEARRRAADDDAANTCLNSPTQSSFFILGASEGRSPPVRREASLYRS